MKLKAVNRVTGQTIRIVKAAKTIRITPRPKVNIKNPRNVA